MTTQLAPGASTAHLVADHQRLAFLPRYLGQFAVVGEGMVFDALRNLSDDYRGGSWAFYDLSNGGFYMAPHADSSLNLFCAGNGYDGEMSADAAGIVATLFALNKLACQSRSERICDLYERLLQHARWHPEARAISAAID